MDAGRDRHREEELTLMADRRDRQIDPRPSRKSRGPSATTEHFPIHAIQSEHLEGKVDSSSFTTGVAPIEIVSSLPALPDADYSQGTVVFLTTDNKLYRSLGASWSKAVDGGDISAGTITGDSIQAGTITAAKLSVSQLDTIAGYIQQLLANYFESTKGNVSQAEANRIEVQNGRLVVKGQTAFSQDAQKRVVHLGKYTQALTGSTETSHSDAWDAGDTNEPSTAISVDETDIVTGVYTETVAAGSRMKKQVVSTSTPTPSTSGIYTLQFQIGHKLTWPTTHDVVKFETTVVVESSVNGTDWTERETRKWSKVPAVSATEEYQTFEADVDIEDTSPTNVYFRIKHSIEVNEGLSGPTWDAVSTVYVYDEETGSWPTNAYSVDWTDVSGNTQDRASVKLFGASGRPHIDADPISSTPTNSLGKDGDIVVVDGGHPYIHDDTEWVSMRNHLHTVFSTVPGTDYSGAGATEYLGVAGVSTVDRFRVQVRAALPMNAIALYVTGKDPGASKWYDVKLFQGANDTTHKVRINGGSSSGNKVGFKYALAGGQSYHIQLDSSASCPTIWVRVTVLFEVVD